MIRFDAELLRTAYLPEQFPPIDRAEVALVGRSNVGKSTLLNALIGRRLAKVSATPGKTESINFYSIRTVGEGRFFLVDVPGSGYASRGKDVRRTWDRLTEAYFRSDRPIILVVHLLDIRHGPLENDRLLDEWLAHADLPTLAVFTKVDKIARSKQRGMMQTYMRAGLRTLDIPLLTSGETRQGVEELKEALLARLGFRLPGPAEGES
jgi:GTP-binding protein